MVTASWSSFGSTLQLLQLAVTAVVLGNGRLRSQSEESGCVDADNLKVPYTFSVFKLLNSSMILKLAC